LQDGISTSSDSMRFCLERKQERGNIRVLQRHANI
jgi:hypothetical protein